jgi:hypothetical protein
LLHRTRELRHACPLEVLGLIDSKNAQFISVESEGLALPPQIVFGRFKVTERGFGLRELPFHQTARRIINVDQERAGRRTSFKPREG